MPSIIRNLILPGLLVALASCMLPPRLAQADIDAASAPAAVAEPGVVRMLTYNVRVETDPVAWDRRRAKVMEILAGASFDIVAIQEASELMIADYQAALPDHYYVVGERSDGHRGDQSWYEYNPIFFDPARFEKMDAGSVWVGEDPARPGDTLRDSKAHGRVFTWLLLRERETGRRLAVGNVHIHGAQAERAAGILVETLRAHADGADIVLLGDFNSVPDSKAHERLTGPDGFALSDAMTAASAVSGGEATVIGVGQTVPEAVTGFKTGGEARRIDYVFADPALRIDSYRVVDSRIGGESFASDHFPLAVTLHLPDWSPPAPQPEGEIADGLAYSRIVRAGDKPLVAHVVTVDLTHPRYRFLVSPGDPSGGSEYVAGLTSDYLKRTGAVLAINGSYFLPFSGGSPGGDDYYPHAGDPASVSGAAVSGGQVVSPVETDLDIRVNAIVCFDALLVAIEDGQVCPDGYTDGLAAGPRLLADGAQRDFSAFDNRYASTPAPRTAMGVSEDGKTAWIVTVDGRQDGYSIGADLNELADIFARLGARDAINLDGGGSTTLVIKGPDGAPLMLNRPIHTGVPGRERPVANQIALLPAGAPAKGD